MKKEISILLPVYNESEILHDNFVVLYRFLQEHEFSFEIIIVDDSSTDDSYQIAKQLQQDYSFVKVLRHQINQGPCSGLKSGPSLATKQWLLLISADMAIPLTDILELWIHRESSDIVVGYIEDRKGRSFRRQLQSKVYTTLVNRLFNMDLKQVNYSCLYRTSVVKKMKLITSGVALHAEILIRAKNSGCKLSTVGLGYQERTAGKASGTSPVVILKTIAEMMKLRWFLRSE